ncbi:porin [Roseimaritima sediminicola]|uniref:porin n=1 Tax=Roseimaritima sediminicola TaxID=2662066 RepID=UPI0012983CEF|nr:porin [Roseimaritima sediminicola]
MRLLRISLLLAAVVSLVTHGYGEEITFTDLSLDASARPTVEQTSWSMQTLSGCNVEKPVNGCNRCNRREGRQIDWLGLDDVRVGGWLQLGYHSSGLGTNPRAKRFNDYPDHVQLQQAWLFAEKLADGRHGWDLGGRIDYVYGTDGPNTQAFGTDEFGDDGDWDNDWDNGGFYGHALPQLYGEVAYGDVSVKFGHFYTIIGYEVVAAPDNFFYSHSWQMNNIEPFTHTGVLGSFDLTQHMTAYAGWTAGWDSGFADNGDAFLGGLAWVLTPRFSLTYTTSIGRLGESIDRLGNDTRLPVNFAERGHMHSLTTRYRVSNRLAFISQKDFIDTELQDGTNWRRGSGFTNYFLYDLNRDYSAGLRFEWWQVDGARFVGNRGQKDVYMLTLGLNCRPASNLIVRPEARWDWGINESGMAVLNLNENGESSQFTFGVDAIVTF